ncbi:MAG: MFS transporter [Thermoleophilia bacterium]|nr:MFS transporter [Thermoleophilia bacterium]MDH4345541.1 MFS transporter [Thermoleophilia bacterium]MDH5332639.1 MFS transporter [Thermoleophilia bacterium]
MTARSASLGLRANAGQFALLVGLNAVVGAMAGLERSVVPLVGEDEFGVDSRGAILLFVLAFGVAKALANLSTGPLAQRLGRRRVLVLGWLTMAPVPLLVGLAPAWWVIVVANVFLGAGQGLAWSMTVVMKIDLVGPRRRGLALGLNESAGYLGVAAAALLTGIVAATIAPRTVVWVGALVLVLVGLLVSITWVRDTAGHVAAEQAAHAPRGEPKPVLVACSQAGLANNLNDALAWGLVPVFLAARGATVREIAVVAALYPAVWGSTQVATGWLSDHTGRKPLIVSGMLLQAAALALLAAGDGDLPPSIVAAVGLGLGTALVYPTLIAAVSDAVAPRRRAHAVGAYRFWRDMGLAAGALVAGLTADAAGAVAAIAVVAALTAASGLWVAATPWVAATERPATAP